VSVRPIIIQGDNPYRREVQGKANEPITVAALLDRSRALLSREFASSDDVLPLDYSLEEVWDRLEENAPRIAIIGGSPDHPAHIMDFETTARAAVRIWQNGGVPFQFSTPVLCDGTAQSHTGMCYSLESRNAMALMIVNQMEAQSYHGAFVIQGCDKQPLAAVSALASLDLTRQRRGDAPVFATFAPAHVLKGGTIPADVRDELEELASEMSSAGHPEIADDLRDALAYVLQCSSNTQFQGVFQRAASVELLTADRNKYFEKRLGVSTCDGKGGICAFNGTGNSSRHVVAALGLVHPALELLTEPPHQKRINLAVDALFTYCNRPEYSVSNMVRRNVENAVRIHSTTGGSTNLIMHLVAAIIYAGVDFSIWEYERIRTETPIPDLFNYSLTQGRTIFELASQCCSGQIRGMETVAYELMQNGVSMSLDAPTATGTTWRERLSDTRNLSASGVKDNPIILSTPRRPVSGIDILRSNFFESAVVKISGMPEAQLDEFDKRISVVIYFENEDDANAELLEVGILDHMYEQARLSRGELMAIARHNTGVDIPDSNSLTEAELFRTLVDEAVLKFSIVISGQGPQGYGMPEMFNPMQHINANRHLKKLAMIVTDGRYSGVSYGAAIGHVTPEACLGGDILYLRTGDLIQSNLRARELKLLDREQLAQTGAVVPFTGTLREERRELGEGRLRRIEQRRKIIAPTNRLRDVTDAAHGVVPRIVAEAVHEMTD
jgi:dihydroxyacid dehydratase/phosphogluconate dehydratase